VRRLAFCLAGALLPGVLLAQHRGREIEMHFGRWMIDGGVRAYELRLIHPLGSVFSHGLAGTALVHERLGRNRAFYGIGYELHAWRFRRTLTPYLVGGVSLGLATDTSAHTLAAMWGLGAGLEWRPLSWIVIGGEARYRLEDRGPQGFWRVDEGARQGVAFSLGVGFHFGGRSQPREEAGAGSEPDQAALMALTMTGRAADVVRAALDALGTPYRWGGSAENGFDCSGLVQYAYGQHGIRLPRQSRDQARAGTEVTPMLAALEPGDVLLFAAEPGGGVTHVGMYVGEGRFIHSASTGVQLSRLDSADPEAAWWYPRWVGARRIIQ
jgi:cell wall-associated NlpC family hydrolase